MKKYIPFLIIALMLLSCSLPGTPTPATEPPVTIPPVTEPPVTEPPIVPNVTCNELSFYLDPALASSYVCETVPESTMELETHPQYIHVTLQGYVLSDKFFVPQISVYPVAAYSALLPDAIPNRVAALQALIAGAAPGPDALPFLPTFNAAQTFHAQYQAVPFLNGGGIRFLTLYAQYFAPVNNHDLFYTYQGLTPDGQYWVSAILPVNHPMLPANADNPPNGQSWEDFSNNYEPYLADMVNQLNAQPAGTYIPGLGALDALVASIRVQP